MARQESTRAAKRNNKPMKLPRYVNVTIPLDREYYDRLKALADENIRPASSQAKAFVVKALDALQLAAAS